MEERIMTDEQLMGLHDDIRDGISMIVEKKHYYDMEAENERLKKAISKADKDRQDAWRQIGTAIEILKGE